MFRKNTYYNGLKVLNEDVEKFNAFVLPKIEAGEKINVFFQITCLHLTYYTIHKILKLKKLPKNINLYIFNQDTNAIAHGIFKEDRLKNDKITRHQFTEDRKREVRDFILSQKIAENFHVYSTSELWKRLVNLDDQLHFINFLSILEMIDRDIKGRKIIFDKKFYHIVQSVADLFFINAFHKLFPEDFEKRSTVFLVFEDTLPILRKVRYLMVKEKIINSKTPLFLVAKPTAYFEYRNKCLHWKMSLEEVTDLIKSAGIKVKFINRILEEFVRSEMDSLYIIKKNKIIQKKDYITFKIIFDSLSFKDKQISFAYNIFKLLEEKKQKFLDYRKKADPGEPVHCIKDKKKMIEITNVLKNENMLDILFLANGTLTQTEIAKKLNKHLSNISRYVSILKQHKLIKIENRKLKRTIKALKVNFDHDFSNKLI